VTVLNVLLIDDDPESLRLMSESLPGTVGGNTIRWELCGSFEEALQVITDRRFDIVVTDVYRDRTGPKQPVGGDPQAGGLLERIRERRFCPVVFITGGVFPPEYREGPFLKLADKSAGDQVIVGKLEELIQTGVPELAHRLHDELDRSAGSYLWGFLEENWSDLETNGLTQLAVLDRLLHRRASVQLGRLEEADGGVAERPAIEGAEFYLSPRITTDLRLGQIMKRENEYCVVLTPHCYLAVQPGQSAPRADFILTVAAVPATAVFDRLPFTGSEASRVRELGRRIQSPARFGQPEGRYWFLPGFLTMPDLYADLLQLQSLPTLDLLRDWESFAVLDVPFAEALQSSFVRFYSAVGLPVLDAARFSHMMGPVAATDG
jgi:CheY-like chemotaxis protein